jgi:Protein of unknown function (DUF1194)
MAIIRIGTNMVKLFLKFSVVCMAFAASPWLLSRDALPQPQTNVAIELVLALDASASMTNADFALQVGGIVQAFRDPLVHRAIERAPQGVAIAIMQWGGPDESAVVLPFRRVASRDDSNAFATEAAQITRQLQASSTSISTAVTHGVRMMEGNEFSAQRLVIDVSGDGRDTDHAALAQARVIARENNVTVNGLAIESEDQGLTAYYRAEVMTGANSFVVRAANFEDYVQAFREKLLEELRPLGS